MGWDGTRKSKKWDGFDRYWPNVIASNDQTIACVDQKWEQLGLGPFIESPSNKYKLQLYGSKAVVDEEN